MRDLPEKILEAMGSIDEELLLETEEFRRGARKAGATGKNEKNSNSRDIMLVLTAAACIA